jgi:hypothetical protein
MRRATLFSSFILAFLLAGPAPSVARADDEGDDAAAKAEKAAQERAKQRDTSRGIVLGVRTGAGFAIGTTYGQQQFTSFGASGSSSRSFSDAYAGMVPIILDVGYRIGRLYLGPWLQYGIAFPTGSSCPTGFSCSASDVRLGFAADYHILRRATWDPWLGVGLGYEWTSFHADAAGMTLDDSLRGIELFDIEAGLDWDVGRTALRLGGFLMTSFAQFTDFSQTSNGMLSQGKVSDLLGQPEPHGWFVMGVRGRLDL